MLPSWLPEKVIHAANLTMGAQLRRELNHIMNHVTLERNRDPSIDSQLSAGSVLGAFSMTDDMGSEWSWDTRQDISKLFN